ncbi:MAG: anhydro-N-acetylmuramic acid kinase [Gammaproteobacteria bacterium]|nr:anhydro-N-acetylmuramic acid kinase [Gammaproteobacteria bacterium]
MPDIYIGLMSGTSMDAVDAVVVQLSESRPQLLATYSEPLPAALHTQLLLLAQGQPHTFSELVRADVQLGKFFAHAALRVLHYAKLDPGDIHAIGSHGQTVWHISAGEERSSLQIADPNIIAEITGITTVADFRRRDIAAGGQGAPLVPAFHAACFHSTQEERVVLNIGGIANITILSKARDTNLLGFDTGPGNTLLDIWAQEHQRGHYDNNGEFARNGRIIPSSLEKLLADGYFRLPPPKSTGREYFNRQWLHQQIKNLAGFAPADIQATLCELTAISITQAIEKYAPTTQRVLVCGGGVNNTYLLQRLQHGLADIPIEPTTAYGVDPKWVEAIAFAWLAKQTLARQPGNLPSVTGARRPVILGAVYYH